LLSLSLPARVWVGASPGIAIKPRTIVFYSARCCTALGCMHTEQSNSAATAQHRFISCFGGAAGLNKVSLFSSQSSSQLTIC